MLRVVVDEHLIVPAVEASIPDRANEVLPEKIRPARTKRAVDDRPAISDSRAARVNVLVDRHKRGKLLWHPKDQLPRDMDAGFVDHEQLRNGATADLGAFIFGFTPADVEDSDE